VVSPAVSESDAGVCSWYWPVVSPVVSASDVGVSVAGHSTV